MMEAVVRVCAIVAVVVASISAVQVPTGYPLAVNDSLRFRLTVQYTAGGVSVGMCDSGRSCSYVTVLGVAHGLMGKHWNGTATTNCMSDTTVADTVDGTYGWKYGDQVTFVARREADRLVVWVDGRPARTAEVALQPGQGEFKFVSYIGSVELLDIPDRVTDGYQLAVGEEVSVRFQSDPGRLIIPCIGVCGARRCTQLMVVGVDLEREDGQLLGYYVGTVQYNVPGNKWYQITEQVDTPNSYPLGEYWLQVARRSDQLVEVWLRENPDWKVQLDTTDRELRVWTDTWYPIFTTNPRTWASVSLFSNSSTE